ncbi:MAG TPA: GNAT family N-acetyltransferase [Acetobacteraceae bacterium]|nr:GNAT family N-acetyltransferase [Acetobacteraceae bacterium]
MLEYARARPGEPVDRVSVRVTFMRMDQRPADPAPVFPPGAEILPAGVMSVAAYRDLYNRVGQPWLWWLRRMMPDEMLGRLLADPSTAIHLLRVDGEVAGFFELDASSWPDVNLSYFGLLPDYIGRGLGWPMLRAAIEQVFSGPVRGMTVNTCTADHPRALPNYLRAGFRITREITEFWNIPRRLGFDVAASEPVRSAR